MSKKLFSIPRLGAWRADMQSSDWSFYGLTYLMIFGAFTTVGLAATKIFGPSEGAEERRKHTRDPARRVDVRQTWKDTTGR